MDGAWTAAADQTAGRACPVHGRPLDWGVAGADRLDAAGCRHPAAGMTSSTVTAGFLSVLVSCAGPLLIYLQAARAMGFDDAAFSPWVMAISVPAGVTGIGLGLLTRAPIVTA